jgi:thioredoxin 1
VTQFRGAQDILSSDFEEKVMASPDPVLVDFHRKSCHGCRQLAPTVDGLAQAYEKEGNRVLIFKCAEEQVMRRHKVYFVPQLILFVDGKPHWIDRGVNTVEGLQKEIDRILAASDARHQSTVLACSEHLARHS